MAGDWIKMRTNLWDDPRVSRLCDITGIGEAAVIGALYWLWSAADEHTEDGTMPGLSVSAIDRKTGVPGIGAALIEIGWVTKEEGGLRIVRFEEHNGTSAKRRCSESRRKMSARDADKERTQSGHDAEEKQQSSAPREEKSKHPLSEQAAAGTPEPVDKSSGVVPLPAASEKERAKAIAERLNGWAKKRGNPGNFQAAHPKIVEWVRLGVRDPHLKDAWEAADQARHRDGSAAPINTNFLHGFVIEEITESGLPPKGPDICCVCGATATRKEGSEWYCSGHDRHSERKAA